MVVVGLAYGLAKHLNGPEEDQSIEAALRIGNFSFFKKNQWHQTYDNLILFSGECCKKLVISGTVNEGDFYQEMMGEYVVNKDYPQLDFTQNENVGHVPAQKVFPVYAHQMFADDPQNSQKHAFLYFYYNTEPRKLESHCPEGCWIISKFLSTNSSCSRFYIFKILFFSDFKDS